MARLINTNYLYRKASGGSYAELIAVVDSPDFGGAPETVDITTQRDTKRRNMNGLQESAELQFTAWYPDGDNGFTALDEFKTADKATAYIDADHNTLSTYQYRVGSETGEGGIYEWQGKLDWYLNSGTPGDVMQVTITISDEGPEEGHWVQGS